MAPLGWLPLGFYIIIRIFVNASLQSLFSRNWLTLDVICLLSILYTWSCIIYPRWLSPLRVLPTAPGGSIFFGHFWQMHNEANGESIRRWQISLPHDGLIRYHDIFNSERVVPLSSNALAEVLVQRPYDFIKPPRMVQGLGRILGVGLFLAEGEVHKRQRRSLQPAFAYAHLKTLYPIFWSKAVELMELVSAEVLSSSDRGDKQSIIDVGDWASRCTLDIIGLAGMGNDFGALQNPENELYRTFRKVFEPSWSGKIVAIASFLLPPWMVRCLPVKRNEDIRESSAIIQRHCRSLIAAKRERKENPNNTNTKEIDILSVAMSAGTFTDTDLVNQLMTFLAAGHETTASAFCWSIYALCRYPDVQARLATEVHSTLFHNTNNNDAAGKIPTPETDQLDRLPYLRAVCNEVLRLYPPVPLTIRVAALDTTIQGHFIPKNTAIMIPPLATNLNKSMWGDDAEEFNPDRWIGPGRANSGGADSNYAYLTFLQGPRSCIGMGFARAELACMLAAWVGGFESEFEDPGYVLVVKNGIACRPKGLFVRLKARGTGMS